jgi:hypothetical protein
VALRQGNGSMTSTARSSAVRRWSALRKLVLAAVMDARSEWAKAG